MFEKNLGIAFLLDFYGDVLDAHTRGILRLYYDEDLSLAEIAESEGISRQGVRHVIKKGEEQLSFFEDRLGLAKQFSKIKEMSEELCAIADEIEGMNIPDAKSLSSRLREYSDEIVNK